MDCLSQVSRVEMEWAKAQYSVNKGLWGTSVVEKKRWNQRPAPEEAYPSPIDRKQSTKIALQFTKENFRELTANKWIQFLPLKLSIKSHLVMQLEEISTLGIQLLDQRKSWL